MMCQIYACTGKAAKTPYYFEKAHVNVYSIEELCYVIYEDAFLIDSDILSRELVNWIDKECGLTELSGELYSLINRNAIPQTFVRTILDYVGFYSKDEIKKVESILDQNVSMNVFEKQKARADFLVENRHFLLAVKEYEKLLSGLPESEVDLKSHIYNNLGVTYMHLYQSDEAADCFKKAYELSNDENAYRNRLAALRLTLSDDDYIRLVSNEENVYRISDTLESELERAKAGFDESNEARELKEIFALKDSEDDNLYYEKITNLTESIKADYRDITLEAEGY